MGRGLTNLTTLFFLLGGILSGAAQSNDTLSDPKGESFYYFERAGFYFERNQLDSSIHYLEMGLPYYRQRASWVNYINCYNGLSSCHYEKADYMASLRFTEQALTEAESRIGKNNSAYTSLLNNLAHFAWERRHFSEAFDYLAEALRIEEEMGNPKEIITILHNLSLYNLSKGDFGEGLRYGTRALQMVKSHYGPTDRRVTDSYKKIAQVYTTLHKWEQAKDYLLKGLKILEQQVNPNRGGTAKKRVGIHLDLAEVFLETQKPDSVIFHIRRAEDLEQNHIKSFNPRTKKILAEWQKRNQLYDLALQSLHTSLKRVKEQYRRYDFLPIIGVTHQKLAEIALAQGTLSQSLDYAQAGLRHFSGGYPLPAIDNPPFDSLVIDKDLLLLLDTKARCLLARYRKSGQPADLQTAQNTYQLALRAIAQLRQSFLARASKEELAQTVLPIYEGAIQCLYTEYAQNPQPELIEAAFQLAESNKAILLLEALNDNTAKSSAGIPDSLLRQEQRLRREIAFLEQKKAELQNKGARHSPKTDRIDRELFELYDTQQALIRRFEAEYPRYYQLKFDTQLSSITQLQQQGLDPGAALIEYFVGEQSIYLFTIWAGEYHWQKLPKDPNFATDINRLRRFLQQVPQPQGIAQDFRDFQAIAHRLYRDLIEPAPLPASIQRLTIVPDDLLGYLPFEVLLRRHADTTRVDFSPQNLAYLIEDFTIAYSYSASLLLQNQRAPRSTTARQNFIGFAPQFAGSPSIADNLRGCEAGDLAALRCNEREVTVLRDLLGGSLYRGEAASKASFVTEVAQYRILHLATHACVEDQQPML
ncbi:MAG: CHAT domain-containing protein, partial [Bacteroidota bacterium]